ncbi:hypothetical protein RI129_010263 [Pyrocoelia pectoralis]|uniref:Uncharacterized protein n=1 Tax=Pyrocoelia pectoralis TaxID=417401 RepID=A0AAN7VAZ0_9COLE
MDPWTTYRQEEVPNPPSVKESKDLNTFEDNFKPLVSDTLPDSKEYLASLETKLAKLKADPNVLQQLAAKREACMRQLLIADSNPETDLELDTPIEPSPILRTIAPSKQALTEGELVTLIQYDQLINSEQQSKPTNDV